MVVRVAEMGKEVKMEGEANAYRAHLAFLFPARTNLDHYGTFTREDLAKLMIRLNAKTIKPAA
jgi:hypothetical protein